MSHPTKRAAKRARRAAERDQLAEKLGVPTQALKNLPPQLLEQGLKAVRGSKEVPPPAIKNRSVGVTIGHRPAIVAILHPIRGIHGVIGCMLCNYNMFLDCDDPFCASMHDDETAKKLDDAGITAFEAHVCENYR